MVDSLPVRVVGASWVEADRLGGDTRRRQWGHEAGGMIDIGGTSWLPSGNQHATHPEVHMADPDEPEIGSGDDIHADELRPEEIPNVLDFLELAGAGIPQPDPEDL